MPQVLHKNAKLTIHQRKMIKESKKSIRVTVWKWKHREEAEDAPCRPKRIRTVWEEVPEDFWIGPKEHFKSLFDNISGLDIYLVPESRIRDLDRSWHQNRVRSTPWTSHLLLHEGEEEYWEKLYYTVLNRVFLEMHSFGWKKSPLLLQYGQLPGASFHPGFRLEA